MNTLSALVSPLAAALATAANTSGTPLNTWCAAHLTGAQRLHIVAGDYPPAPDGDPRMPCVLVAPSSFAGSQEPTDTHRGLVIDCRVGEGNSPTITTGTKANLHTLPGTAALLALEAAVLAAILAHFATSNHAADDLRTTYTYQHFPLLRATIRLTVTTPGVIGAGVADP